MKRTNGFHNIRLVAKDVSSHPAQQAALMQRGTMPACSTGSGAIW